MAESVVKLRVDSNEYEAKIRRAVDGLRAFGENCQKAGQSVAKADKETLEYVQAIGQMETVSKNAKGKINEMTNAFTDLSVQYRHLTDQEKQSPFGQALAQSLDQLKLRIKDAKDELSAIGDELGKKVDVQLPTAGGLFGGGKLDGMLQVFGGNLMTKAAGWATSLVSEMGNAIQQGIELAKAGEGIRIAFDRLNRPDLLDKLREATHGTVTDLELMKQAVKFNDFNLSLDEMGTMLAFAQQKAKDTGQSVDYMVDSIVTGLGRKSLMILDNLGLSAAEIKERMKETGDMTKAVGAIIREQMAKAGDYVETAADRAAQANVSLQNKMEELGRKFAPVEEASNHLWTSMKIAILDVVGGPLTSLLNGLTEAGRLRNALSRMNGEEGSGNTKVDQQLKRLKIIRQAGGSDFIYNTSYNRMLGEYDSQIADIQKKLDNGGKWESKEKPGLYHYESTKVLNDQLRALKVMRDKLVAGAKELSEPVNVDMPSIISSSTTTSTKKTNKKGNTGSTAHKVTPQERAADMVSNAERTYSETLLKNSIRLEAGIDSTLENKKKELSAQERLFDAYSDAYATYKDPKYKTAIDESAEKIKSLAVEVKGLEDEVKKSKEKWERGLSGFNADTMAAWMKGRQGDLSKTQYGTAEYGNVMANIADMNTIKTILEQSMKAGIDASQFNLEPLWEKVFDGENIPDATWQKMVDVINEKLKEMNIKPIKIDFKTGDLDNTGKNTEKSWRAAAQAVQSVGSALQQIEDPSAKIAGIVGQAIANIALGFAQATTAAAGGGPFAWIAAIAGGIGTMVSTIAAIKSATAGSYADGGIIPGHDYNDGMIANVSSGELILNRAQQGSIAAQLSGSSAAADRQPYLDVETIWLGITHRLKRLGMGEIVTTNMR